MYKQSPRLVYSLQKIVRTYVREIIIKNDLLMQLHKQIYGSETTSILYNYRYLHRIKGILDKNICLQKRSLLS